MARQEQRITSDDDDGARPDLGPDLVEVRTLRPEDIAGTGEHQRRLSTGLYL